MSDILQNVKIKYIADASDLDAVQRQFLNITAEEQKTHKALQEVDNEAKKLGTTVKGTGDSFKATGAKASDSAKQASNSFSGLSGIIKGIGPSILAAFSVGAIASFGSKVISITSEFEKFEAVLTNTLGSKSAAQSALNDITQFAATTNFSVQEATSAFVKLANQGFTPTIAEMTKLADIANATGKSFDQLVEGILDAQTGQFERLKEFGILAQKEGDHVQFSFKGVKTQVDFTGESIRNYILGLGDLKGVSGSTAAISETLGGKISNLGDSFDALLKVIGTRLQSALKGSISLATDLATALKQALTPQDEIDRANHLAEIKRQQLLIDQQASTLQAKVRFEDNQKISQEEAYQVLLNQEFQKNTDIASKLQEQNQILNSINKTSGQAQRLNFEIAGQQKLLDISNERLKVLQKLVFGEDKNTAEAQKQKGLIDDLKDKIEALNKKKVTLTDENEIRKSNIQLKAYQKELDRLNKLGVEDAGKANAARLKNDEEYYRKRISLVQAGFKNENDLNQYYADQKAKNAQGVIDLQQKQSDEILNRIGSDEAGKKAVIQNQNIGKLIKKSQVDIDKELLQVKKEADAQRLYVISSNEEQQLSLIDKRVQAERDAAHQEYIIAQEAAAQDPEANIALIEERHQNKLTDIDKKGEQDRLNIQKKSDQDKLDATKETNQAELELARSREEQRKAIIQQAAQTLQGIGDSYFQSQTNQRDAELSQIQTNYNTQIKLAGDNQQLQQIAQNRFNAQQLAIKRRQAQADKVQAEFDIGINTAVSVSKVLYNPYLVALVAALGLAQEAAVASRPLPKYNKGTKYVPGVDVGNRDSVLAELTVGEAIIPREENKKFAPLIGGILDGTLDPGVVDFILNRKDLSREIHIVNDNKEILKGIKQGIKEALGNQPTYELSFDERGYSKSLKKSGSVTTFLNNYYRTPKKNG